MQRALILLGILLIASTLVARADTRSSLAPADEYFGRFKQSILEIRNRLDRYDYREDGAMAQPDVVRSLDDLQETILDWQHKYPRDPWIPRYLRHLMREYARARDLSSDHARTAYRVMTMYPRRR
jgi:hypothetical protein